MAGRRSPSCGPRAGARRSTRCRGPRPGAHRGQGGRAALRPVPRRRRAARPGDALDRRGHGHRPRLRCGVRQVAGRDRLDGAARPGARCSCRSPTATSARSSSRSSGWSTSASTSSPPRAPPTCSTGPGSRPRWSARSRRATARSSTCSSPARSARAQHPVRQGTRGDGYEIRQAAVTNGVPCITTLAGILAAIQGSRRCARPLRSARCRSTRPTLRGRAARTVRGGGGVRRASSAGGTGRRAADRRPRPRSTCEVLARRREGAYWLLSFSAPEIAERARPGQFVRSPSTPRARCCAGRSRSRGCRAGPVRRHRRRRLRRARAGHRVADHVDPTTSSTSSGRSAPRSRCRSARCRACWSAAATARAAVLPRRGAARAGAAGRHDRRRRDAGPHPRPSRPSGCPPA
jgi:hypothetical protein